MSLCTISVGTGTFASHTSSNRASTLDLSGSGAYKNNSRGRLKKDSANSFAFVVPDSPGAPKRGSLGCRACLLFGLPCNLQTLNDRVANFHFHSFSFSDRCGVPRERAVWRKTKLSSYRPAHPNCCANAFAASLHEQRSCAIRSSRIHAGQTRAGSSSSCDRGYLFTQTQKQQHPLCRHTHDVDPCRHQMP